MFAKLKTEDQESRLRGVADTIERCFNDQGIVSATDHGFTAHATVINLSRDKNSKRKGILQLVCRMLVIYSFKPVNGTRANRRDATELRPIWPNILFAKLHLRTKYNFKISPDAPKIKS